MSYYENNQQQQQQQQQQWTGNPAQNAPNNWDHQTPPPRTGELVPLRPGLQSLPRPCKEADQDCAFQAPRVPRPRTILPSSTSSRVRRIPFHRNARMCFPTDIWRRRTSARPPAPRVRGQSHPLTKNVDVARTLTARPSEVDRAYENLSKNGKAYGGMGGRREYSSPGPNMPGGPGSGPGGPRRSIDHCELARAGGQFTPRQPTR
jgi:hypothetical protein